MRPAHLRSALVRPWQAPLAKAQPMLLTGLSTVALGVSAAAVWVGAPLAGPMLAATAVLYPSLCVGIMMATRSLSRPPRALWNEHLRRAGQAPMEVHHVDAEQAAAEVPGSSVVVLRCTEGEHVEFTQLRFHGEPPTGCYVRSAAARLDTTQPLAPVRAAQGELLPPEATALSEWLWALARQFKKAPDLADVPALADLVKPGAGAVVRLEVRVVGPAFAVAPRWDVQVRRPVLERHDHAVAVLWRLVEGAGQRRHMLGLEDAWAR